MNDVTIEQNLDLLTVAEAAKLLRVSTVTIHRWVKQGRLPACHVGPRTVRIRRADVEQLPKTLRPESVYPARPRAGAIYLTEPRSLTAEERQRALQVIAAMAESIAKQMAERHGIPFDESWPSIRASRDERPNNT